jgi:hypothetical protein
MYYCGGRRAMIALSIPAIAKRGLDVTYQAEVVLSTLTGQIPATAILPAMLYILGSAILAFTMWHIGGWHPRQVAMLSGPIGMVLTVVR